MYEEYVSLRTLRLFFFSPSAAGAPDVLAAFLVALSDADALGALEAVEGGATAMAKLLLDERVRKRCNNWQYMK